MDDEQTARDAFRAGFMAEPRVRSGTYTPPDDSDDEPVDCPVLVEHGIDLVAHWERPFFSQGLTVVNFLIEDVPAPRPNGTVTFVDNDDVLTLDTKVGEDGYIVRMQVK